ncbi:C1 family peptidase [bacterium]|nr:C1 family peptidase [bacterium]
MKRSVLIPVLLLLFSGMMSAQTIDGQLLSRFRRDHAEKTPRGVVNVVANNQDIKKIALNAARAGQIDTHFAVKLDIQGITDQKSTGRCWLFTGLNVIRQKARERLNVESFEFSENFNFFYDQLEKANLCLEGIIETRGKPMDDRVVDWLFGNALGDGGVWNMMVDVVEKYGAVPKEIMPDTEHGASTGNMRSMVRQKIREAAVRLRQMHERGENEKALRRAKEDMLGDIYRLLAIHLGEPPETFRWRYKDKDGNLSEYKTYTPRSFFTDVIGVDLGDYVMLMNDPTRPYDRLYEIDRDRNLQEGTNWTYVNLTNAELKAFAKKSLLAGEAMYFSCDVGKYLDREAGYLDTEHYDFESLYGIEFTMNKTERILSKESASSHGMALVGVDTLADGTTDKWLLENSWGDSAGQKGYLIMTDRWFDEYGFRLVVHKKFLSPKVLEIAGQEPVLLPPWDAMF